MVSPNRRLKLFNRVLKEFLVQYNKIYSEKISFKTKDILYLKTYKEECNFVFDSFIICDKSIFPNISLCKMLNLEKIDISSCEYSIWQYLHNLYILTLESSEKNNILEKSKESLAKINNEIKTVEIKCDGNQENGLNTLISEIAEKVKNQLDGKSLEGLDPMQLMNELMSGKDNINMGGVNFSDILKSTTESIQNKVDAGEIDIGALKDQALSLLNSVSSSQPN